MNDSTTGRAIGSDVYAAQLSAGDAWKAAHGEEFPHLSASEQDALIQALALQMMQIMGNGVITHAPGWDLVTSDPRSGGGLDRPMPALAQYHSGGVFQALLLKTGTGVNDWTALAGGGGGAERAAIGAGTFATNAISFSGRPITVEVAIPGGSSVSYVQTNGLNNGDRVLFLVTGASDASRIAFVHGGLFAPTNYSPLCNYREAGCGDYQDVYAMASPGTVEYIYLSSLGYLKLIGGGFNS